ncbi:MAG: hypothetical protein NTU73_04525 [Ignavibacteriae bacterium]|nr:hypothetical protein [Ignavibacteriota bacterium]
MKSIYILFVTLIFLIPISLFSQEVTDSTKTIKFSERIPADLEIYVKVKETGAIGYAYCFKGNVVKVTRGIMSDASILITVVAGDTANYNTLHTAGDDMVLKLFLMFNKANEEYSTTYITGFVDSEKNSWRIIAIQKK